MKRKAEEKISVTRKKFLTVSETASELNVTDRAIWQRLYRGQIPYRRWGKRILISRDELQQFLEALPGVTVEDAVKKAGQ